MGPRLIGWCPHLTRHRNCTKVGYKPTHPKGKRAVRKKLAKYMETQYRQLIGGPRTVIKEGDYLCTGCYNFENNKMNKKYGILPAAQDDIEETNDASDIEFSINLTEDLSDEEMQVSATVSPSNTPIKYMNPQSEALSVLNGIFDLVKIERIVDMYV